MLPSFVQPRRSGACTMAPLHDLDPGDNDGGCAVLSASAVIVVGHGQGKDVEDPLGVDGVLVGVGGGRREPRTDLAYAEAPRHNERRRRRVSACWANQRSSQIAVSSTGLLLRQGDAGFAVLGIAGSSGGDTIAGGHGRMHQGDLVRF